MNRPSAPNESRNKSLALRTLDRLLGWLREHYGDHRFYLERDLVWTCQEWMRREFRRTQAQLKAVCEWPVDLDKRTWVDLAITDQEGTLLLAIEFKYEPDHKRAWEFSSGKFSGETVFWRKDGVHDTVEKCRNYPQLLGVPSVFILVDEGGYHAKKEDVPEGTSWEVWECGGEEPREIHVLMGRFL